MKPKWYQIGKYKQHVTKDNITCTCHHGSLFPGNYKEGKRICKHIKQIIQNEKKHNKNRTV